MKLGRRSKSHNGWAALRHNPNQPACPYLVTFVLASQSHVYTPWVSAQPVKGPSKGLVTFSVIISRNLRKHSFQALVLSSVEWNKQVNVDNVENVRSLHNKVFIPRPKFCVSCQMPIFTDANLQLTENKLWLRSNTTNN